MKRFWDNFIGRPVRKVLIVSVLFLAAMPGLALADDWVAERLRGRVFVLTDGVWIPLSRGDIVSDASPIQSTQSGRATFGRDNETITIGGETIIQIIDLATSDASNTVVKQRSGTVTIEAQVRNVQHFRVDTPFLAAVVKGTRFTVSVAQDGAEVAVQRGRVEVRDQSTNLRVEIVPGQRAGNIGAAPFNVDGQMVLTEEAAAAVTGNNGSGPALGTTGGVGLGIGNGNGQGNSGGLGLGLSVGGGNGNGNNGGLTLGLGVGGGNGDEDGNGNGGLSLDVQTGGGISLGLGLGK